MEWMQIAAWIVWAWVAFPTLVSVWGVVFSVFSLKSNESSVTSVAATTAVAAVTTACALNAILGLMLIQTLGLTV